MASEITGVYPGTFDPLTNGHLDIIHRASRILDRLVIGVAVNAGKGPLFTLEDRVQMVEDEVAALGPDGEKISVVGFDNLLVQFAQQQNATIVIRGLRAVSDFDYEFQMASMNAKIAPDIETVCLMASDKHQFIASRLVKEIAMLDGDVTQFLTPAILEKLSARVKELKKNQ